MPVVEGYAETARAARYVEQLSSHFGHEPGGMKVLASEPGQLVVDLGGATWSLRADPAGLTLRVESADASLLTRLSARVAERVEQIGRRDGLTVHWQPAISA